MGIAASHPKKDQSQICLNIDMRVANQAIPHRHTQHPMIDDVVNELSGSTVFSHLDMSKGYHELELKESLRNVTTFSTHIGLYRYKRLNYSTRSAAEIFQETIREELTQDLKGVFNISDDIIVHGHGTKEHNANLKKSRKECHVQQRKMRIQQRMRGLLWLDVLKGRSIPRHLQGTGYQGGGPPKECSGT